MLAILFRGIENFKMFDMVNLLTGGGPGSTTEVASITLKREAFEKWRTGYSSAFAIILFVAVFGLANIYVKALNRVKKPMSAAAHSVVEPSPRSKAVAGAIVITYALISMIPLFWIFATSFKTPPDFDRLSAEGRVPAEHGRLLQPVHDAHAADAGVHRRRSDRRPRSATRSRASATW